MRSLDLRPSKALASLSIIDMAKKVQINENIKKILKN